MSAMTKLLLTDLVSGVNHVPSNYIRPVSDRPNLTAVEKSPGSNLIPVIDLQGLNGPNHLDVITQIGLACQKHGFFQVCNSASNSIPSQNINGNAHILIQMCSEPPNVHRYYIIYVDPIYTLDDSKFMGAGICALSSASKAFGSNKLF